MPTEWLLDGQHRHDHEETTENNDQTPLISRASGAEDCHDGRAPIPPTERARKASRIIAILCVIIVVGSASAGFQNMSMTRIFEDVLCREYYGRISLLRADEPIDESMCKVDAIQSKLAYLFAIMYSLNAGVSVLASLPWGIAADRIGRRPVLVLAWVGMALAILWIMVVGWFYQTLSPKLIWLSPVAYILGGGSPVLAALVNSIVTDSVPESERSINFMRIHGASMVGNLISPALASLMMSWTGPWLPLFVSFLLTALPAPFMFLLPETLKRTEAEESSRGPESDMVKRSLRQSLAELKKSADIFNSLSMSMILLITMMQLSLVICTFQFLSQFASKRYGIPLADTGYIQSLYGLVFIGVSFFFMPFVASVVLKPYMPACMRFRNDKRRDLFLARASYLISMLGTVVMGLSPRLEGFVCGLVLMAFGVSAEGFMKNIATLYATAEQRSRLFTILGLSAIGGDIWISTALAKLFELGMGLGGSWIGLPYLGVSVVCCLMFGMSLLVKLPGSYRDRGIAC
ncbi:major facilitator superfamily domain-containing protein [Xylaria sp. CBS 124048]|nr:major facilitator superfamily domain-containing protein [Xylaria sp. CBS 124048]